MPGLQKMLDKFVGKYWNNKSLHLFTEEKTGQRGNEGKREKGRGERGKKRGRERGKRKNEVKIEIQHKCRHNCVLKEKL